MKDMFKYVFPIWISMIINTLLGITDFLFLGSISQDYLTAVGIAFIPFTLISSILIGIGIETNRASAKKTPLSTLHVLLVSILASLIIVVLSKIFLNQIFFFARNSTVYQESMDFFSMFIISLVPTAILYVCTGILRGNGVPQKSIYFSVSAVVLNLLFDFLFLKINLFNNPLSAVAFASVLADCLVAAFYVFYIYTYRYAKNNKMDLKKFLKNTSTYSIEKVFSASTVVVISNVYIVMLAIKDTTVFFSIDRFFATILMFAYGYFEWVIYSESKGLEVKNKGINTVFLLSLLVYNLIILQYIDADITGKIYSFIYVLYCLLFLIERSLVARIFSKEKGKSVNTIILVKNLLLIATLQVFYMFGYFNLISFGLINSLFLLLECLYLRFFLAQYKKFHVPTLE